MSTRSYKVTFTVYVTMEETSDESEIEQAAIDWVRGLKQDGNQNININVEPA